MIWVGPKHNCPITWEAKAGLTKAVDITMETRCPVATGLEMEEEARSHGRKGSKLGPLFQTRPPPQTTPPPQASVSDYTSTSDHISTSDHTCTPDHASTPPHL